MQGPHNLHKNQHAVPGTPPWVSPMKVPFHPSDLVTVLGVALILVWTPVYVAHGNDGEAPTAGHAFTLPPLHYGDRVEYELIVQEQGEAAATTGTVAALEYREPEEGEGPPGTLFVEEYTQVPLNVEVGPLRLVQSLSRHERYRDPEQVLEFRMTHHQENDPMEGGPFPVIGEPEEPVAFSYHYTDKNDNLWGFNPWGPYAEPMVYRPTPVLEAVRDLVWNEEKPTVNTTDDPSQVMTERKGRTLPEDDPDGIDAPVAALHQGRVLFGTQVEVSSVEPMHRSLPNKTYVGANPVSVGPEWTETPPSMGTVERWDWVAEELPVYAGAHVAYVDEHGRTTITFDLVPKAFHRGQEPIPVNGTRILPSRLPDMQTDLPSFDDPDPFVGPVSLSRIATDLAGPGAPGPIQDLMEGARFAGVAWSDKGDRLELVVSIYQHPHLVAAAMEYRGQDVQIEEACDRTIRLGERDVRPRCHTYPDGLVVKALKENLDPPSQVVPRLRTHVTGIEEPVAEYGHYLLYLRDEIPPGEQGRIGGGIQVLDGWYNTPGSGRVMISHHDLRTLSTVGGFNDDDRVSATHTQRLESPAGIGSALQPQAAEASQAPSIVSPFGPEPIYGGLALVLIGLAVRVLLAVKSGAFIPVTAVLYAKIKRDKSLEHHHREALMQRIEEEPGIHLTQVARSTGLSRSGAYHHLETLVKSGHLSVTVLTHTRHYFPAAWTDPKARIRAVVARHDEWENVLRLVESGPGITLRELERRLQIGKSSVSRIGSRLATMGLVHKKKEGRVLHYYPVRTQDDTVTPATRTG